MHSQVRWILSRQIALSIGVALAAWMLGDANAAASALIGGGIGVAASCAYVLRALRPGVTEPLKLYRAQAAGEAYKFAVTLLLFALVFIEYKSVAALPLFLGYASTFVIYWVALLKNR